MATHLEYSDDVFIRLFSECSFPTSLFNHEAHIRLAWILLQQYGYRTASNKLCQFIERYDFVHGDGTKYDRQTTLSCAWIIHARMQPKETFLTFIQSHPDLKTHMRDLLHEALSN